MVGQMAFVARLLPDLVALGEPRWVDSVERALSELPTAARCSTAALRYLESLAHHLQVPVPDRRCLGNFEVGREADLVRKQRWIAGFES